MFLFFSVFCLISYDEGPSESKSFEILLYQLFTMKK